MRAAVTTREGKLTLADIDEADLLPGQVRVKVGFCGICGSDLHWRTQFPAGTVMGHEVAGRIIEAARDVTDWALGDRVNIIPMDPCGECQQCRAGRGNVCAARRYGIGGPRGRGGYAEHVIVFSSMLVRTPEALTDRAAALVEPLSVGLHGVNVADADPMAPTLVIGAGSIGLVTLLALRARGFKKIAAVEPNPARRANVERLGIAAVDSAAGTAGIKSALGRLPATIFECAGHAEAVSGAIDMIAVRGRIVLLSAPSQPVSLPQFALQSKEAEIRSAVFYTRIEFEAALQLLTTGAVPSDAVPTSVFSLADAPRALDELLQRNTPHMKVLLQP